MRVSTFPHCKWGYISAADDAELLTRVPSLQVRVYRCGFTEKKSVKSSITASEGISVFFTETGYRYLFPHCKWGYIDSFNMDAIAAVVPSLQVRVYRENGLLIADAGTFPHCKWGYIESLFDREDKLWVPSLQVRVYRLLVLALWIVIRSLTASEGISFCAVLSISAKIQHISDTKK